MQPISNSLTKFLDLKIPNKEDLDQFIDDLEDEIFGMSNRDFYLKYKGDIKELAGDSKNPIDSISYETELLAALIEYYKQRI